MKPTIRTASAVMLLCAITRNLGYLKSEVTELVSLFLFLVLLFLCLPLGRGSRTIEKVLSGAAVVLLTFIFSAAGQIPRTVLVAAALLAGAIHGRSTQRNRGECAALALTVSMFGLYILGLKHSAYFWHLAEGFSKAYSHYAAGLAGVDLLLSATAAGLHNCVLFLLLLLSIFLVAKRRSPAVLIAAVLGPLILMGAFIVAGAALSRPFAAGDQVYMLSHLDLQPALVLAGLLLVWIAAPGGAPRSFPAAPRGRGLIPCLVGPVLLFAGIVVLIHPPDAEGRGDKILLYDRNHIVWRYPVFGWYGDKSGGMFGYLPRYLRFRGFEAKRDTISEETLKDVDLVVAINLVYPFTEEEHRLTWDFVRRGGALLALGDHTGKGSIREPFNSLLQPVGIEFEFDAAKCFTESWVDGMEWRPHETTRVIRDENSTQIWTGASLKVGPGASPVVLGRFAWSDSGDADNAERAYLGDFKYNQGELLGDVVLAAEARYGKGKVLVFGDTSTFQNGALVQSDEFAHGCIQWLCKTDRSGVLERARIPLGVCLVVLSAVLILTAGLSHLGVFMISLVLLSSPVITAFTGRPPPRTGDLAEKIAYLDKAHGERFDLNSWNKDSIGGLTYNLMRNGFFPFVQRRFSEKRLQESDLLLVSGPTRDFTGREIQSIDRFVRSGNVLIVAVGHAQYKMAPSLMDHFGFSVGNVPLGRVEALGVGRPVRFYDAYPVASAESDTTVLCGGYGYPVAVARDIGDGRVIAMGDTRFFQNKNLEDRDEYIEENVMFLKALFEKLDREVYAR